MKVRLPFLVECSRVEPGKRSYQRGYVAFEEKYGDDCDILLMSWPVPTEDASVASILWGEEKPMIYIGEVTDLKVHQLGGCASDSFFEMTKVAHTFKSYRQGRSGIEHASVRQVLPEAREILKRALEEWDRTLRSIR